MKKNYLKTLKNLTRRVTKAGRTQALLFLMLLAAGLRAQVATTCVPPMSTGCTANDYIDYFELNGVASVGNAGCNGGANGYTLYTSPVRTLMVGQTYTWTSTYGPSLLQCLSIWIDLNNDGFYTSTEQLANTTAAALGHSGSITIPNTATTATNIAMRVRCKWNSAFGTGVNEACAGYTWGETEDYKVVIIPCPGASFSVSPVTASVCPGNTLVLSASAGGTAAVTFTWTGGVSNGVAFTPTASTIYTVSTGVGGCLSTNTVPVTVYPGLSISPANPVVCNGSSVTLTASGGTVYSWSSGPSTSTLSVGPSSNTGYTVSGNTAQGCNTSKSVNVTVIQGVPTLSIVNTSTASGLCPGKSTTLTASGAVTYTWTGGITNGVGFVPSATTDYSVTGTNVCGNTMSSITVSVHPLPTVSVVASTNSLCSGSTATLTGIGNASSYTWTSVLPNVNVSNGVSFMPTITNTYITTGTSALSCTATASATIQVVQTPTAFPSTAPAVVCLGGSATLTATGATNYTWSSVSQTVQTNPFVVTPAMPGTGIYTVTKANANCYDTKTISVITNALPTAFAIATPTLVCALSPATLAVAGGQTYTWTAPNTSTFTGASPVVSPSITSVYTVAAHDGTCVNTTTVMVATNPIPTISVASTSSLICRGQSITMTASGGMNYTWTATSGTFYTNPVTDTPSTSVSYNVKGNNNFGCTSSVNKIILVNPNPTITINVNKPLVCSGGLSTLTASGANTYTWDANANGAFTPSTVVTTMNTVSGPFIYTVSGTYTNSGCQSSKTVQVNVFVPVLTITGNTNTCFGGNITLSGSGGNNGSYSWHTGTGNSSGSTISTTLSAPAIFTLNAMTNSASIVCPGTQTVALGIYFNPTITAVAQRTTICRFEKVELYGSGGVSYNWNNGMSGSTVTIGPINQIQTLNYTVTGTDANGCSSTGTVQVKVSGCTGIDEFKNSGTAGLLIYPNPNNGEFMIETSSALRLTLSNELGQLLRTIILSGGTEHKVSVADLPRGIYFISGDGINQKVIVTK